MKKGHALEELYGVLAAQIEESDFFQALKETAETDVTTESPKAKKSKSKAE
jgi:hypothetical protein